MSFFFFSPRAFVVERKRMKTPERESSVLSKAFFCGAKDNNFCGAKGQQLLWCQRTTTSVVPKDNNYSSSCGEEKVTQPNKPKGERAREKKKKEKKRREEERERERKKKKERRAFPTTLC